MVSVSDELLTVAEAAALLKVSPYTIYRWIGSGRLPAVRYSRRVIRLRRSEVEALPSTAGLRSEGPPHKGTGRAILRFAGILTKQEGDELWRAVKEAREASLDDPH